MRDGRATGDASRSTGVDSRAGCRRNSSASRARRTAQPWGRRRRRQPTGGAGVRRSPSRSGGRLPCAARRRTTCWQVGEASRRAPLTRAESQTPGAAPSRPCGCAGRGADARASAGLPVWPRRAADDPGAHIRPLGASARRGRPSPPSLVDRTPSRSTVRVSPRASRAGLHRRAVWRVRRAGHPSTAIRSRAASASATDGRPPSSRTGGRSSRSAGAARRPAGGGDLGSALTKWASMPPLRTPSDPLDSAEHPSA